MSWSEKNLLVGSFFRWPMPFTMLTLRKLFSWDHRSASLLQLMLPSPAGWKHWIRRSWDTACPIFRSMMPLFCFATLLPSPRCCKFWGLHHDFSSPCLESFDRELHSIVSAIFNISLEGASTWSQAMPPVGFGVVGDPQSYPSCTFRLSGFCCWLWGPHHQDPPSSGAEFLLHSSWGGMVGMERRPWPVTSTHPSQHKAKGLG